MTQVVAPLEDVVGSEGLKESEGSKGFKESEESEGFKESKGRKGRKGFLAGMRVTQIYL